MLESRGGESIKGQVVREEELIELGRRTMETLRVCGPATIQVFRDPEIGLAITDVNTRFGGAFPAPAYAALPGRTYPELIVALAAGETVAPHVGEFDAGMTFTRYYWQLELDPELRPTGREIVPGGPPSPR
jgi:carbamoyl-phosphate synthase large subunit